MYKILLAEDGLIIAFHVQKLLEGNGYEVVSNVTDGEEAISLTKEHNPDLIILDIMLQGEITGIDAAIEIRKFSNAPIIFVSALTDPSTLEEIEEITNTIKLNKPFEEEYLINKIQELLNH